MVFGQGCPLYLIPKSPEIIMSATREFAKRVTAKVLHMQYEDIVQAEAGVLPSFQDQPGGPEQPVGIDIASILAMIDLVVQIIEKFQTKCSDRQQIIKKCRIRTPFEVFGVRQRVFKYSRDFGYQGDQIALAEALLDVAHNQGEEVMKNIVQEFESKPNFNMK